MPTETMNLTLDLLEDVGQAVIFLQSTYGLDALAYAAELHGRAVADGDTHRQSLWEAAALLLQETRSSGQDTPQDTE